MLLPIHRFSNFSKAGLFFSFLNRRPSFLQNKFIVRWIALACCIAFAFVMWFGGGGLRLADSLGFGYSSSGEYDLPPLAPHMKVPLKPMPQSTKEEKLVWESRKDEVRNAFKHSWSNYKKIAFPDDELLPISGSSTNKLRYPSFFLLSSSSSLTFSFSLNLFFFFYEIGLTVGA